MSYKTKRLNQALSVLSLSLYGFLECLLWGPFLRCVICVFCLLVVLVRSMSSILFTAFMGGATVLKVGGQKFLTPHFLASGGQNIA